MMLEIVLLIGALIAFDVWITHWIEWWAVRLVEAWMK